ncbi:MAG: hypothetical protein MI717_03940 [Spirochaetales bacterium]|nr:hypothetical protein [Spirochaetales bacterium]
MKNSILTLCLLMSTVAALPASNEFSSSTSFGFVLNEYADDFGIGLQVSSPYIADVVVFRATGTMQFNKAAAWTPWWTAKLGVAGASSLVGDFARFYGEGGAIAAFPGSNLSSHSYGIGGYGLFGFEFFMSTESPLSYFLEIGAIGCGLRADRINGEPLLVNGLTIQVGFRGYPFRSKKR